MFLHVLIKYFIVLEIVVVAMNYFEKLSAFYSHYFIFLLKNRLILLVIGENIASDRSDQYRKSIQDITTEI